MQTFLSEWMNYLVIEISGTYLTKFTFYKYYLYEILKHQYRKYKNNLFYLQLTISEN